MDRHFFLKVKHFLISLFLSPNESLVFVGWIFVRNETPFCYARCHYSFKSETLRQFFLAFVSEQRFTGRPADSLWEIPCISSSFALDERAGPQNL